jgi:signal transduction histidine kinase/HAMP domain-containing protein
MKFRDLKLGAKQAAGFGFILFIMAGVNMFAINKMGAIKAEIDEVNATRLPRAIAISNLNLNTAALRINQLQQAVTSDTTTRKKQQNLMIALIDQINANIDAYAQLKAEAEARRAYSEEEGRLYDAFDQKWEAYYDLSFAYFALLSNEQIQDAAELLNGEAQEVFSDFSRDLTELVNVNKRDAYEAAQRAGITYQSTRKIATTLLIATIALSAFFAAGLARYIAVPVGQLARAARHVAEGNLDVQLKISSHDEIGHLSQSFNQMTAALREAREKMQRQAQVLQAQQKELQATNQELAEKSQSLERQNAEIERKNRELESAMQKLTRTQQQLVHSEKMASLGQLTAGIAHEINNPINFVSANVGPLRRDIQDIFTVLAQYEITVETQQGRDKFCEVEALKKALDYAFLQEEVENLLNGIQEGAQRTAEIVRGLRSFTRLDEEERKPADINKGIESTLLMLKHQLKNRVEIIKDFGNVPEIACYPGKLNQVFMNLLVNASQAIEGPNKIFIKTIYDSEIITIAIRDTGKGMSDEVKRHLFEPFFTTKPIGEGTGLGLAITYGIIEEHDGNIEVYSEPGKGTEFVITLPAK